MSFKAVWIDRGQNADYSKLHSIGATHAYFDIRWEGLSLTYLRGVRDQGFAPGVYVAPKTLSGEWAEYSNTDGALFAEQVDARLKVIAPGTGNKMPCVLADIEIHNALFVREFLWRWRELRPTRVTDWTLEPWQFGWEDENGWHDGWASELVPDVETADVRISIQFYGGSMQPYAPDRVVVNAIKGGCSADRLLGCYDGAKLSEFEGWDGIAFTMGRIP